MTKIQIDSTNGALSVKLTLDIGEYCLRSRNYYQSKRALQMAKEYSDGEIPNQALLENAQSDFNRFEAEQIKQHAELAKLVTDIEGNVHWLDVMRRLATQCNPHNEKENRLRSQLTRVDCSCVTSTHAILSLRGSLIELIKNSTDALIDRFVEHGSANTMLEMDITLVINEDDTVDFYITDNAGGISKQVEDAFARNIENKEYKYQPVGNEDYYINARKSKKDRDPLIYLGGAGLGMVILSCFLLDGEKPDESGKLTQVYKSTEGKTSLTMSNCPQKNGTRIKLSSPIAPFECHEVKKQITIAHPFLLSLATSPKRKQLSARQYFPEGANHSINSQMTNTVIPKVPSNTSGLFSCSRANSAHSSRRASISDEYLTDLLYLPTVS